MLRAALRFFLWSRCKMYVSLSYRKIMLLTASQSISYALHHQWNLLDPVDFMRCYSFLHSLASTTATLQQQLEGMDEVTIAQFVVSSPWCANTPPTSAGQNKHKWSDIGDPYDPLIKGTNSEGVDDLEPEESNQWHESMKDWQLESQRLDVQPSKVGLHLKQDLVDLVVYDGERSLRSVVEKWSANMLWT